MWVLWSLFPTENTENLDTLCSRKVRQNNSNWCWSPHAAEDNCPEQHNCPECTPPHSNQCITETERAHYFESLWQSVPTEKGIDWKAVFLLSASVITTTRAPWRGKGSFHLTRPSHCSSVREAGHEFRTGTWRQELWTLRSFPIFLILLRFQSLWIMWQNQVLLIEKIYIFSSNFNYKKLLIILVFSLLKGSPAWYSFL